jgi:hypothetical protein
VIANSSAAEPPRRKKMKDRLIRFEIHDQPNSDTFAVRAVWKSGSVWLPYDYGTVGEAVRSLKRGEPSIKIVNYSSTFISRHGEVLTLEDVESGDLG